MAEKVKYKTKQRDHMLEYMGTVGRKHFTAADVCGYFKNNNIPVGTTTVYRQLEQLMKEGKIKKYLIDETSCACYEYIGETEGNDSKTPYYHLKCEKCGKLIHLECHEITEFEEHITRHHGFKINPVRTTFYGLCADCAASA